MEKSISNDFTGNSFWFYSVHRDARVCVFFVMKVFLRLRFYIVIEWKKKIKQKIGIAVTRIVYFSYSVRRKKIIIIVSTHVPCVIQFLIHHEKMCPFDTHTCTTPHSKVSISTYIQFIYSFHKNPYNGICRKSLVVSFLMMTMTMSATTSLALARLVPKIFGCFLLSFHLYLHLYFIK